MGFWQDLFGGGGESNTQRRARRKAERRAKQAYEQQEALLRLQKQFFTQQQDLAEKQNRAVMQSMGYVEDPDTGEFVRGQQTPEQQRTEMITRLMQERQISALEGNAPVDPALERDIASAEVQARQQSNEVGGMESTAGRQIMAKFNEWANIVRSQGRQGEITGGFQNLLGQGGRSLQERQQIIGGFRGMTGAYQGAYGTLGQMGQLTGVMGQQNPYPPPPGKSPKWPLIGAGIGYAIGGGTGALIGAGIGYGK